MQMPSAPGQTFGYSRPSASLALPFGYSGTPGGNTGIGLGNLQVDSAIRPNDYIGLNSFVSVAAHYVVVDDLRDAKSSQDNKELSISMLVFARNKENINKARPAAQPQYGTTLGPNTIECKELTQLNEYLAQHSHLYESADEIAAEWQLLGVVKNETGPVNTMSNYGQAPRSRIINFIVSHRVKTFNYWSSSRIVVSQNLWIMIKKNKVTGRYEIVPWTSAHRTSPSITDLSVTLKDGRIEVGAAIYVGKSSDQTHALAVDGGNYGTSNDLNKSLVKRGLMSTIEIQLGI